jgi:hypothetical protein
METLTKTKYYDYNFTVLTENKSSNINLDVDIRYIVQKNMLFDISNNIYINYDYFFNSDNLEDTLYTYDTNNYYNIINNNICDQSNNKLYYISSTTIYDLSNNNVGSINFNTNIYNIIIYDLSRNPINTINYKLIIILNSKRLYSNYRIVNNISKNYNSLTNNYNTIFKINNINYSIKHNIFYEKLSKKIKFNLIVPDTLTNYTSNLQLIPVNTIININLNPSNIRKEILTTDTSLNLSSIFNNTFNVNTISKTINYLNYDLKQNIVTNASDGSFILVDKLPIHLLNNILANSIMSNIYYNKDIYICSSFNNYIHYNNITSSNILNITNIISWLENYNNTNINQIKIFNQTDQKIYTISDFITAKLQNKYFNFVPDFTHYFPINSFNEINIYSDDIYYNYTSYFEYMFKQIQKLKFLKSVDTNNTLIPFLDNIKFISYKIKEYIIYTTLFFNINNNNYSIANFNSDLYFIYNNNLISTSNNYNNINLNTSYFIMNSNVITGLERKHILDLSYNYLIVKYVNRKLYLSDTSNNTDYLITTNLENINDYKWDLSNNINNIYYKFDKSNNIVLINVSNYSVFPNTLYIYNGLLNRINNMPFGYEIDSSLNLLYNFKYDLSYSILSRVISVFNANVNFGNKNLHDELGKIPVQSGPKKSFLNYNFNSILYNYIDLSNNFLQNIIDKQQFDNSNIFENNGIYIVINTANFKEIELELILLNQYIILYSQQYLPSFVGGLVCHFTTIFKLISGNYIIKLEPFIENIIITSGGFYTIFIGIRHFISLFGIDKFHNNTVFYYWETFTSSINNIINLLDNFTDDNLQNEIFTLNGYIEKIYNKITEISQDITLENNFFEIPQCLFKNKISNGLNIFTSEDSIKSLLVNAKSLFNIYTINNNELNNLLKRPTKPKCSWIQFIGHYLIDKISLKIDDNIIEELDDQIIHNFNFFNSTFSKDIGLNNMIGNTPDLTMKQEIIPKKTLYIPLPFFFEEKEKALPIISLLNSQLSINLKIKDIYQLLNIPLFTKIKQLSKLKIKLYGSYVFLDNDEKEKFAQMRHEYLIKTKKNYKYYINQNIDSFKLDFKLPTTEIFWFYLDNSIKNKKNYWNYTGSDYKEYNWNNIFMNDFDENDDVNNFINILSKNKIDKINWYRLQDDKEKLDLTNNLSILDENEINSLRYYLYDRTRNSNPFISTQLFYNGHKRFQVDGIMSNLVIPTTFYKDTFSSGLNVYTFCRYPKSIQHSGSANFKFANNISFDYSINLKDNNIADGEINIIICELNLLRIASGIGCLVW